VFSKFSNAHAIERASNTEHSENERATGKLRALNGFYSLLSGGGIMQRRVDG
jgi:hypothetical protein